MSIMIGGIKYNIKRDSFIDCSQLNNAIRIYDRKTNRMTQINNNYNIRVTKHESFAFLAAASNSVLREDYFMPALFEVVPVSTTLDSNCERNNRKFVFGEDVVEAEVPYENGNKLITGLILYDPNAFGWVIRDIKNSRISYPLVPDQIRKVLGNSYQNPELVSDMRINILFKIGRTLKNNKHSVECFYKIKGPQFEEDGTIPFSDDNSPIQLYMLRSLIEILSHINAPVPFHEIQFYSCYNNFNKLVNTNFILNAPMCKKSSYIDEIRQLNKQLTSLKASFKAFYISPNDFDKYKKRLSK